MVSGSATHLKHLTHLTHLTRAYTATAIFSVHYLQLIFTRSYVRSASNIKQAASLLVMLTCPKCTLLVRRLSQKVSSQI